jgi:Domain of unknown function (DUF6984)
MKFAIERNFRPLRERERTILRKLFARSFDGKAEIEHQCEDALVKIVDPEGSFAIEPTVDLRARVDQRIVVEAWYRDDNHQSLPGSVSVHVLLHVVDGRAVELEIYKDDGSEIIAPAEIAAFEFWN